MDGLLIGSSFLLLLNDRCTDILQTFFDLRIEAVSKQYRRDIETGNILVMILCNGNNCNGMVVC